MFKAIKEIYHFFKWYVPSPTYIVSFWEDQKIAKIAQTLLSKEYSHTKNVLYIASYYQITLPRTFDFIIALALKVRGAHIQPVLIDHFYQHEDVIFGGIYNQQRAHKVAWYAKIEKLLWVKILRTSPLYLSEYISEKDVELAQKYVQELGFEELQTLTFNGYPVGMKASYATKNMDNSPLLENNQSTNFKLKEHCKNCILLLIAYKKIYKQTKIDVIFSEFPHYYHWHTAYFIAKNMKIPFYGAVMSEKKNSFYFANDSDSFMDPSAAWPSFFNSDIPKSETLVLEKGIQQRKKRFTAHSSVYPTSSNTHSLSLLQQKIDPKKPVVFFPVNVFFDLAVFEKSPSYNNLLDMLTDVIDYFNNNSHYQLILKAHPAEKLFYTSTYKNASHHCLKNIIQLQKLTLSSNIIFLDYDSDISTFDIIPLIDVGIVYTSTTTIEMSWEGKPVITVGENHYFKSGFTIAPASKQQLWSLMESLLTQKETPSQINTRIEASKKYYLLYYYHCFVNFGLIQGNDTGSVKNKVTISSPRDLLPGSNKALDYICEAILTSKPILGDKRWPPLTL